MEPQTKNQTSPSEPIIPELGWIDQLSSLLDNRFTIPGLNTRFGVDAVIGLIPGVGDWISLGISILIVVAMMRRGVSVRMLLSMTGHLLLDATIGSIPIAGDIFDVYNKANRRNVERLRQYYTENPNPPSTGRSLFIVGWMLLGLLIGLFWVFLKGMGSIWSVLFPAGLF
ncbi:MAG: hypothetical protein RL329_3911 [Bacteroidota bacterium]|jgi:hypothetical protein